MQQKACQQQNLTHETCAPPPHSRNLHPLPRKNVTAVTLASLLPILAVELVTIITSLVWVAPPPDAPRTAHLPLTNPKPQHQLFAGFRSRRVFAGNKQNTGGNGLPQTTRRSLGAQGPPQNPRLPSTQPPAP